MSNWGEIYSAQVLDEPHDVRHLIIKRHDGAEIKASWSELYEIVYEMLDGCMAIELYPPIWQVVNEVNWRHFWVLPGMVFNRANLAYRDWEAQMTIDIIDEALDVMAFISQGKWVQHTDEAGETFIIVEETGEQIAYIGDIETSGYQDERNAEFICQASGLIIRLIIELRKARADHEVYSDVVAEMAAIRKALDDENKAKIKRALSL